MKLSIDQITINPEIQLQSRGIDTQTVTSYVEAMSNGDGFPPLMVFFDGTTYWLAGGFHRLDAYRFLGVSEIEVEVKHGSHQDAMIFAAIDNKAHGKPMSQAEKKEAGLRLLELTDWSTRHIAKELAVGQSTVQDWKSSDRIRSDDTVTVVRNDQTYQMDTSNIGVAQKSQEEQANRPPPEERGQFYEQWRQDNKELGLGDFGDPLKPNESQLKNGLGIHGSSESYEWYTPEHIIERVMKVLGEIDLDPCSNSRDNPNVPARYHLTIEDDGLAHPWIGRIYMNPPYGREISDWINHLYDQWEAGNVIEAIALVPARTDTEWFRVLRRFPRCFVWGRLKFSGNDTGAPFPSCAIYLGNNLVAFKQVFSDIGDIYMWIGDQHERCI